MSNAADSGSAKITRCRVHFRKVFLATKDEAVREALSLFKGRKANELPKVIPIGIGHGQRIAVPATTLHFPLAGNS
jgi:hypothetical protein